jgi:GT2 family glycosyltransferase
MVMNTNHSTSQPKDLITLSIVSHNDSREVERLLSSLYLHEVEDKFQVILTDNLGNDLPSYPWKNCAILRNEKPKGFASNHNEAFRHATGSYFCILNPDIIFVQSIFDRLIDRVKSGQADMITPVVVDSQDRVQDTFRKIPTPLELFQRRLLKRTHSIPLPEDVSVIAPEWISGTFMLMKSDVYQKLGGFDERYHLYMEDVDICARARLQGLSILVDSGMKLQHEGRRSSKQDFKYLLWHLHSAWKFFNSPVYKNVRKLKS